MNARTTKERAGPYRPGEFKFIKTSRGTHEFQGYGDVLVALCRHPAVCMVESSSVLPCT